MRPVVPVVVALFILAGRAAPAQEASQRAWQQRLGLPVPLPVPLLELAPADPFAVPVELTPRRTEATPPRKLAVAGRAILAAYVDAQGECLGTVPLEQPFSGLAAALAAGCAGARFEPARTGKQAEPSWVVMEVTVGGTVKESSLVAERLELPDPVRSPEPSPPIRLTASGQLSSLPAVPAERLTATATLRKLNLRLPGREVEVPVRALVRVSPAGRCDRYVPLELESGLERWLESYLASWRLAPAEQGGAAVESWMLYTARVRLEFSALESTASRVIRERTYSPNE